MKCHNCDNEATVEVQYDTGETELLCYACLAEENVEEGAEDEGP